MDAAPHDPPFRAEHIGSLLRPTELLAARAAFAAGRIGAAELEAAEDAAIREVVRRQEEIGLQVVTDGEFRRTSYSDSFTVSGITGVEIVITEDEGFAASARHGHRTARRIPKVTGRIAWAGPRNAKDFGFLKSVARATPKITLPGPAYIHYRAGRQNIDPNVYPDLDLFWSDLVEAYHQEMRSLAEAGCTYLQIDETSLVKLGDERVRALLADRGDDWRDLLKTYVEAVNAVADGAPAGMTVGVHVCRSQDPSWQADVGYDPIAEALFNDMRVRTYFLEYDNARAGTFEPLAALPAGKTVVLGLLSSKTEEVERVDALKRRIEEAARFVDLDRLALSPQCGFATGANMSLGDGARLQWAKLARIVEVADEMWGVGAKLGMK